MARNYAKEIDAVKDDVGALRSDIEKLVKTLSDDATSRSQQAMNAAKEAAAEYAAAAKDTAAEYASAAKEKTKEGVAVTEKKIEENPFTSVAAAFGVGLVLGRIMSK